MLVVMQAQATDEERRVLFNQTARDVLRQQ